jgi:hypothetical protein
VRIQLAEVRAAASVATDGNDTIKVSGRAVSLA